MNIADIDYDIFIFFKQVNTMACDQSADIDLEK